MIENLAERIAIRIKETGEEETKSVEVMKFALIGILHNGITIAAALAAGAMAGKFQAVLLTVFSFMILRLFSGGYHFKSAWVCSVFSFAIFVAVPFISINDHAILIVNALSLLLCVVFAPSNIRGHIRVDEKYFIIYKVVSIALVSINFVLDNSIIAMAFLAQSALLITLKRGEEVSIHD